MDYLDNNLDGDTIRNVPAETAPPDKDDLIGRMIEDRYLIGRKLGQGGFGTVYLASDEKMASRKVVLKIMRDEETANEWSVKKFKHEIEALTRISHPNIVGVFDCGVLPNERPYIVMQHVNGIPLRALITPEGMQLWRAASIIGQIGRALTAAHEVGILHRDLKPENVMIENVPSDDEQVKVIDFGVAKVKDSLMSSGSTKDQSLIGTIAYMSPEQLSAQPVTIASDIYSMGIIAYEMLTGRRPTTPDSAFQLLELQRSGVRVRPSDLRPSLTKEADAAILRALAFDPKERFRRARDFGDLLAASLRGDEETQVPEKATSPAGEVSQTLTPEVAHVLFVDVAGFSDLLMDQQRARLSELQQVVLATPECKRASKESLIRLPSSDGMALVFFGDAEAPVRCATEVSRALTEHPDVDVRMGVHSGLVYRIGDINANMNVAGGGVRTAQRIMESGERGHILVSQRVADDLAQLSRWRNSLHELGPVQTAPGQEMQVFSLYGNDFGNPAIPAQFQKSSKSPPLKKGTLIAAAGLVILLAIVAVAWYALRPKAPIATQPVKTASTDTIGPEQALTYWLTVQKMLNKKERGEPFESANDIVFENGWKFHVNLQAQQTGALYLIDVGPDEGGKERTTILFPVPATIEALTNRAPLDPTISANQIVQLPPGSGRWYKFDDNNGVEKFWMIWSVKPIPELDKVFGDAVEHKGVVSNPDHLATLQTYISKYDAARLDVTSNKAAKRTYIKGRGEILVDLIELTHERY